MNSKIIIELFMCFLHLTIMSFLTFLFLFFPFSLQTPVYLIPPVTHNTIVKPEKFQIKKSFLFSHY